MRPINILFCGGKKFPPNSVDKEDRSNTSYEDGEDEDDGDCHPLKREDIFHLEEIKINEQNVMFKDNSINFP